MWDTVQKHIKKPFKNLGLPPSTESLSGSRRSYKFNLGAWGEDLACYFFCQRGMDILQRNLRGKGYEIDLIAQKKDCLYFVEVKTRTTHQDPHKLMPYRKKKALQRGIYRYLQQHPEARKFNHQTYLLQIVFSENPDADKEGFHRFHFASKGHLYRWNIS